MPALTLGLPPWVSSADQWWRRQDLCRIFTFVRRHQEQAAPERVGGGLPRLRFAERMQTRWRPVSLDGLLPDDHRVRLVWSFVEGLDLTALLATIKASVSTPTSFLARQSRSITLFRVLRGGPAARRLRIRTT